MMTKTTMRSIMLFFNFLTVFTSCNGQNQKTIDSKSEKPSNIILGDTVSEIPGAIQCIFQDIKNNFWFGTDGKNSFDGEGVYKYDGKTLIQYTVKDGLCHNQILSIQEDQFGNIWLSTGNGVSRFDGQSFTTFSTRENLTPSSSSNQQWKIEPGDLWFPATGNRGGVYRYSGNMFTYLEFPKVNFDSTFTGNPENGRNPYGVYVILKDKKGNLWLGTQNLGVCRYDGLSFKWLKEEGLLGPAVRTIFEDKKGNIWIGNNGAGLIRYNTSDNTLTNFTKEKKLENLDFGSENLGKEGTLARVWSITDDKEGNLWIGTIDAGVWKFDGKTLTNYTTKDGLGIDFITTIYKDKNDGLWFGTDGFGVYTFHGKTFMPCTVAKVGKTE